MPDPESTDPATTPDQSTNVYGVTPAVEQELRALDSASLEAHWRDVVNFLVGQGEPVVPYTSPTGDVAFEERVNEIMQDYLVELQENPEQAELDAYNHSGPQPAPQNPDVNVAQGADPVDLFNGSFAYRSVDFQINGAGFDFVFARSYSQLPLYRGPLGTNWDHAYNLWLRVSADHLTIHRSTGALREELFRKHEQHAYWMPPDGAPGVILEQGESFVLRRPDGVRIRYQPHQTLHPSIHVASRIEDRFGNHVALFYSDGLLVRVQVNHPGRVLDFTYDTERRITSIRDFTGRTWRYTYDDLGNLVAVTTPATADHKRGLTTWYEYVGALTSDPQLQHALTAIIDPDGRLYLENEYGTSLNLLSYRRVVRQRQGGGDVLFDYADVVEEFEFPYEPQERPAHQTVVTERDGRQMRYLFNRYGNMILKEEYARLDGIPRRVSSHYRYNRDGQLVGTISPLGTITQALYGRDLYERQHPRDHDYRPETDDNLTAEVALQFGNLLAVVKRGRYYNTTALNLAGGLWASDIFPDILQTNEQDAIQKFTYEAEFAQLLTASDPRVTESADPAFVEGPQYHRRLTRYSYSPGRGFEHLLLAAIELPAPVRPDGAPSDPVTTRFPAYDAHGRIVRIAAPNGLETLHAYAGPAEGVLEGFLKTTTLDPGGLDVMRGIDRDQLGRVVRFLRPSFFDFNDGRFFSTCDYNELSQIVAFTGTAPFSITTRNRYHRTGALARSEMDLKDAGNSPTGTFVTENRYDEELNLVAQTIGDGEGRAIKRTKVVFDRASRPFLFIAPSGRKRKTSFNERSLIARTVQDYGRVHATTLGFYDADARLVRVINPRGGVTKLAYDPLGRCVDTEDAKGNRIIRHFDKIGNLLVECLFEKVAADTLALLFRREFTYDELGRLIVAGANKFDQAPPVTASQLLEAFRESGPGELLTIQTFYDAAGNVVKEVDQDGREFVAEYDLLGRPIRRVGPNGDEVRLAYDKEGNILRVDQREVTRDPATNAVTNSRHFAEVFAYDELNRLIERRTSLGTLIYKYDSRGKQVEAEDPLGNKIANTYDVFGRLVENVQPLHSYRPDDLPIFLRTRFTYDLDDQKTTQTDASDRTTRFQYDTAGRLAATVLPDGRADSLLYDRFGNLIEHRDWNGLIRRFAWDELNRNTTLQIDASGLADGSVFAGASAYAATYDALGRFRRVANEFVVTSFTYNSLNHVREEITEFTAITGMNPATRYSIRRDFGNSGAVIGLTCPSGREIRYRRDILDRVVAIEQVLKGSAYPGDPTTPEAFTIAAIEYDGSQIRKVSRHNGTSTEFSYDFGGRTVGIDHASGSARVLTLQFLYDALGNMRQKVEASDDFERTERFRYDSLSRLVERALSGTASMIDLTAISPPRVPLPAELPDHQAVIDQLLTTGAVQQTDTYNTDFVGNRTSTAIDGVESEYQTNDLDQYTNVGGTLLRYEPNGNLVEDDTCRYRYDQRNQLSRVLIKAEGHETEFLFDYFGRRCVQRAGSQLSANIYDGHNLLEEYDEAALRRIVTSDATQDGILTTASGGRDWYLLSDLVRSIRYVFDGTEQHAFYIYDPFGKPENTPLASDENPFRFASKRQLGGSGKYDFIYRTYDPALGRFMQRDPKGFVDGTNRYTFLRNNPLVLTDPLGLESRSEHAPIAAKLGAELAYRHPKGFTLLVPDNFDNDKIRAYKERIHEPTDRGVGIRSRPAGAKNATDDIRRANRGLRDAFEASLPGGQRPAGTQIDHRVELQHIIRGNAAPGADTVRPQDHRVQNSRLNASQGSQARIIKQQQVQAGAPVDASAGGVSRVRDQNKVWNRQGYRTGVRFFGHYNMVGGTGASLSAVGDDIREGNFSSAALNTSAYLGGAFEIGGVAANSTTLLNAGRVLGAPAAVIGSGVIGVRIGTNLYDNYVDKEMSLDAGSWVEEHTGSRVLGATAAAAVAVGDAIASIPEAAIDYAAETWTLDPDEIDWGKTFSPWRWF